MLIQTNGQIDENGFSVEEVLNRAEMLFSKADTDFFNYKKMISYWDLMLDNDKAEALMNELISRRFLTFSDEGSERMYKLTDLAVRFVGDFWSVRHSDISRGDLSGMWKEMSPYL